MFDRETRKEKQLETQRKMAERAVKPKETGAKRTDDNFGQILQEIEEEFEKCTKEASNSQY